MKLPSIHVEHLERVIVKCLPYPSKQPHELIAKYLNKKYHILDSYQLDNTTYILRFEKVIK
jgi:hypothetical protein